MTTQSINFITIVLDGMPFIANHLQTLNRLTVPWTWHVVEGVALPHGCTKWVKEMEPRLSNDGTSSYLDSIRSHPNVHIYQRTKWNGKIQMVNEPLRHIKEPCLLWQVDSDELWLPHQIEMIWTAFRAQPTRNSARFYTRCFVGQNIVTVTRGGFGNHPTDPTRVWRFEPGMRFETHEPPVIKGLALECFSQEETELMGCVFDHYTLANRKQAVFKEEYYGKPDLAKQWDLLQTQVAHLPGRLGDYIESVKDDTIVDRLIKSVV